ncbi:stage II sporulation protein GA (sporulation sigma-E factor processing peptidase) [Anoxybacillus vitaminiphilus]|uniref:Sporulation sigma-E factor-processing peptidase n=1 Tax=Paranoxybacillus vitaminiphilus TaxID=581036 RepID=A0A327YRV8_9BACL|nr:sigma-E processing peptidase SpoIIGA [Anoxybacillus vitaminiphilus]RAK23281.1 stage II sporulation protein GA (sporulation sigma-E factor processing peptidase) [Anoxybacillus vitaminiphilus]
MSIYLDIIWLLNVCFDSLLLWLTAIMLKRQIVLWRIALGAFIGSLLVLFMFTPFSLYASHPLVKLLFSFFIVIASFGFKRFRYFIENLLTFYFATFMIGGGMIALHNLLQNDISAAAGAIITSSTGTGDPVSWLFVLLGFPTLWFFSRKRIDGIREKKLRFESIVDVFITLDEVNIALKGLIDSGNQLYDPITKTPVMIVDLNEVKQMLPQSIVENFTLAHVFHFTDQKDLEKWHHRLRIIPYRAVGKEQQFLLAFKPDKITIRYENRSLEVTRGLIGLNEFNLSTDGEYQCIVHPKMVQTAKILTAS